jgi:TatD DNase family protein
MEHSAPGTLQAPGAVIDSHCHLADEAFAADLEAVVGRAREAGLEGALVILEAGNDAEADRAEQVARLWPAARFAVGVHPHQAHAFSDRPEEVVPIVSDQIDRTPGACAVGEIGLDYHYDFSPRDLQQAVFRAQIALAVDRDLPIVVHTREADEDTIAAIREAGRGAVRGVLHCFTGTPTLAAAALDLGFYISLAGIVTFPRAGELRDTVRGVPLDRLLAETDSPFLAPVPHRGTRNEPVRVAQVVETLAGIHGVQPEELARRTSDNFRALFGV